MTQHNETIIDLLEYTSGIESGKSLAYAMLLDESPGLASVLSDVQDLVSNLANVTDAPIPLDWKLGYLVGIIAELIEQAETHSS